MKLDQKKILYIWEYDVSFGDSLTNFHENLSLVRNKLPLSIIYAVINPRTYNTGVTNLLLSKGLIDFVYPFNISKINEESNNSFKTLIKYLDVDIIIHNNYSSIKSVELIKEMFSNKIHLQTPNSNFGLNDLFKYFNINYGDEYLGILKKSYHSNYINQFVDTCIETSNNKKTIAIFSGSTRPLANVGKEGVTNIINLIDFLNMHTFLVGTSINNLYDINGVNWEEIYTNNYKSSTNIIGNNWTKTTALLDKVDIIISGPTGAAMISPLINKKQILILGGDSPIMKDCINEYTYNEYTLNLKCNCINYPCDINSVKKNKELYDTCFKEKNAKCLNENLNIIDLQTLLEQL